MGAVLTFLDITERRLNEERLREDRNRFAFIRDVARLAVWRLDLDTDAMEWSEPADPLFGLEPGTFGGTFEAFMTLVHPDDQESLRHAFESARREGTDVRIEHRIVWPDGSIHWVNETARLARDANGDPIALVGVVMDADAPKDQAHRQQREHILLDMMPEPVCILDDSGHVLEANQSFQDLFQMDRVPAEGRICRELLPCAGDGPGRPGCPLHEFDPATGAIGPGQCQCRAGTRMDVRAVHGPAGLTGRYILRVLENAADTAPGSE